MLADNKAKKDTDELPRLLKEVEETITIVINKNEWLRSWKYNNRTHMRMHN